MDKLIVTAACDSSVSYPTNPNGLSPTRENAGKITREYVRCVDAGAAICHLHGVRELETEIQPDGRKLSRLDIDGWAEISGGIRNERDTIVQFGIAGARLDDRLPLLELRPDMMSVAFNAHDEYFQPDPSVPPNCIYALHPIEELRSYASILPRHGVKPEIEVFHTGAVWNLNKLLSEDALEEPAWVTLFLDWEGGSWSPPTERALSFLVDLLPPKTNFNVSVMSSALQWDMLSAAIGMGGHVRVGFEDNPFITPGAPADSNAALVEKIVRIAGDHGREIADVDEARNLIGLPIPTGEMG